MLVVQRSEMSRCILTMSRCILTMSRCILTMSRCILTMSRCILTMSRCILTMSRCILTMSRCILTMSRCILTLAGRQCQRGSSIHSHSWNAGVYLVLVVFSNIPTVCSCSDRVLRLEEGILSCCCTQCNGTRSVGAASTAR